MFLLSMSKYKSFFLFPLLIVFALSFTLASCTSKPAEEEIKVTKRMKIKYPEKKAKKKVVKKKVVKKKPSTRKPSVKWVAPKKATIKKKATAKKKVAPKKTVAVKKSVTTTTTKKVTSTKPNYVVSVASFKERDKAAALSTKLSKAGYNAYVTSTVKDSTTWYRVRCGFFDGYSEATRLKEKLVKDFYVRGAWVDKPTRAEVQEFAK
ncbi:MAG: SPOR domain-containing protein [Thermodesulfobacteriota bacterium]